MRITNPELLSKQQLVLIVTAQYELLERLGTSLKEAAALKRGGHFERAFATIQSGIECAIADAKFKADEVLASKGAGDFERAFATIQSGIERAIADAKSTAETVLSGERVRNEDAAKAKVVSGEDLFEGLTVSQQQLMLVEQRAILGGLVEGVAALQSGHLNLESFVAGAMENFAKFDAAIHIILTGPLAQSRPN